MAESSDEEVFAVALAFSILSKSKKKKSKRWWVKPWLERRLRHGAYHALMSELEHEDQESLRNFLRMGSHHFEQLYLIVGPLIGKQETVMRQSISARERLAVTLRFLASGDSYHSLSFLYRIGRSTLSTLIPETCRAIVQALKSSYLKMPATTEEWMVVSSGFDTKWQFPHCIGAIDGKHVEIKAPPNSGSVYYNYKDFHSIILLAVVDAHCRFIWYDLGANGRQNDAGIYANCSFAKALEENKLKIPDPSPLGSSSTVDVPFFLVGDDAFPLKSTLIKPYPQRGLADDELIFNYRLSRARRTAENAFGILVNRFRVLSSAMNLDPEIASTVTESCMALHNFLKTENDTPYSQELQHDRLQWPRATPPFFEGNNSTKRAREIRDELKRYFWNEGDVPFQWQHLEGVRVTA